MKATVKPVSILVVCGPFSRGVHVYPWFFLALFRALCWDCAFDILWHCFFLKIQPVLGLSVVCWKVVVLMLESNDTCSWLLFNYENSQKCLFSPWNLVSPFKGASLPSISFPIHPGNGLWPHIVTPMFITFLQRSVKQIHTEATSWQDTSPGCWCLAVFF